MTPSIVQRQRAGSEIMDDPHADPRLVVRTLEDVAVANRLFGGTRAVLREVEPLLRGGTSHLTLLDVGAGLGDVAAAVTRHSARMGVQISATCLDASCAPLPAVLAAGQNAVCGDALRLPFADASVDIAMCSQVLHHFSGTDAVELLRELDRVAVRRVIVSDIRRSIFAAMGIWLASYPLRFHPVSRHDGVVSVQRGFTVADLHELVHHATGSTPAVSTHLGFRIAASWTPVRPGARH